METTEFNMPPDLTEKSDTAPSVLETPASEKGHEEVEHEQHYLTGVPRLATMVSITLVAFLMLLDTSIVATAVPRITSTFHSLNDIGWYGTAYLVSSCALQPLTGKMYTYFDIKWTFLGFFSVFELGSVLCGAATSSNMLIVGRAFAGMGASGLFNGAYTIVAIGIPEETRASLTGILIGISQLGVLCGPLIGGALTQHASWRWCFYINLPCAAVVAPLLLTVSLPNHRSKEVQSQSLVTSLRKLDLIGFVVFAGCAIQVLLALNWGGTSYPWNSATIIGLFCGSGAALIVFLAWEHYMGEEAMIPFSLVRRRVIWASCINYACLMGSMLTSTYYLPMYFQAVRNASPTMSGVDLLPSILGTMLFGIASGVLVNRVGYYLPFAVASGAFTILGTALFITLTPSTSTGHWIGFQILQGAGRGMGIQMPILAVQHLATPETVSIVNALVVFAQNFGGAVFLSLAQVIFSTGLKSGLALDAPDVSAERVILAGASAVRETVPGEALEGVLRAYNGAIVHVMYLGTAAAGGAMVFAFAMGWVSLKKK